MPDGPHPTSSAAIAFSEEDLTLFMATQEYRVYRVQSPFFTSLWTSPSRLNVKSRLDHQSTSLTFDGQTIDRTTEILTQCD